MKFIVARKKGMSQLFAEDGTVTPVTILEAGPVTVTQVKTEETDGYKAVQVGFGTRKEKNVSKAVRGHLKGNGPFAVLKEYRTDELPEGVEPGATFTAEVFEIGDKVDVTGTSKGRGFAGVVKRHGFKGGQATHGNKDQQRMPGSIGAQDPQHVFKGTRMGGHMGDEQVTTKNLKVMEVDATNNIIKVKGAVPGANGGFIVVQAARNAKKTVNG